MTCSFISGEMIASRFDDLYAGCDPDCLKGADREARHGAGLVSFDAAVTYWEIAEDMMLDGCGA